MFDLHLDLVHGEEIKVKKDQLIKEEKFEEVQQSEKELSYPITPVKDKSFQCDKCNSFFKSKQNLKRHIASVHEEKKSFKCDICDYSCSQKGDLNKHVASVHEGKKPFQCNICSVNFALNAKLKEHIASVHEGKKPFQCSICDSSFSRNDYSKASRYTASSSTDLGDTRILIGSQNT